MALPDFFSNKKATEENETAIDAPALSTTKIVGTVGTVIGLIGAAAAKVSGVTAVKVASIGAGTLVILGVFGLVAADMFVRQRAEAAKLRWGSGEKKADGKKVLVTADEHLVLQEKHNSDEYELRWVELEGETVTLIARRNGETLTATFQPPS